MLDAYAAGIRVQVKALRTAITIKQSNETSDVAALIASLRPSYSRSVSRNVSHRNSGEHNDESSSLTLRDTDFFVADKFKVDQVLLRHTSTTIILTIHLSYLFIIISQPHI